MYLLADKSRIALGVFTSKETLNNAIAVCRTNEPYSVLYYQEIKVDVFDSTLIQFFTIHPEKLIEIDRDTNSV